MKGSRFLFFGRFSTKLAAARQERRKPGSFIRKIGGYYYVMKRRSATVKNPKTKRLVRIYGRVLRIEAQKIGRHQNCDAECKRCNHKYVHDFKRGAVMYGQPDGSILIKKG